MRCARALLAWASAAREGRGRVCSGARPGRGAFRGSSWAEASERGTRDVPPRRDGTSDGEAVGVKDTAGCLAAGRAPAGAAVILGVSITFLIPCSIGEAAGTELLRIK